MTRKATYGELEKRVKELEKKFAGRKRAEEEVQPRAAQLELIYEVGQRISSKLKLDALLSEIVTAVHDTFGYYGVLLLLVDEETGRLNMQSIAWGHAKLFPKDLFLSIGEGMIGSAAATGKTQLSGDVSKHPHYVRKAKEETKSELAVPIKSGRKVIAVLDLQSNKFDAFDETDVMVMETLADQVAVAIENVRLYEAVQQELIERKQAEEALKREKDMAQGYLHIAGVMLATVNAEEKITLMNKKGCEILGYSEEELIGRNWFEILVPQRIRDEIRGLYREMMTGNIEQVEYYENPLLTKDGEERLISFHSTALRDPNGQITGVLFSAEDITERKRAEEEKKRLEAQFQQAQRMESIGTLAGGIAHDFNNILTIIIGYTELSVMNLPEEGPIRENMNRILKASERARDLVKQILTFSRQREGEKRPIQVQPILKESLKLLRPTIPTTIEIRENIASTSTIVADPTQLHQVIMNLCTNAYQAMSEKGGVLEVGLKDVELGPEFTSTHLDTHPGPYLKLTVKDTGHGIAKKNIERIFEPYYTTKEKTQGTGMGLAVVHGIVKGHGGAITISSEQGKGTTFHVYLPIAEAPEELLEAEQMPLPPRGNERILFVDDEPSIVDIGKRMLEALGYKVTSRTSGIEALEAFRAKPNRFDLVITDMTMPHMTGDRLAKEVMKIRPDIPVILCTGFSERISEEKAKAMGIRAFVMKPVIQRKIAETIRKVLERKKIGDNPIFSYQEKILSPRN